MLVTTFAMATLGIGGTSMIGNSDQKGGQHYLEEKGYKIESYEGKAGLWDRAAYRLYTADKFKVSAANGQKSDVIVGSSMFVKHKNIIIRN